MRHDVIYLNAVEGGMKGVRMHKLVCDKCGKEIDTSTLDKFDIRPNAICRILRDKNGQFVDGSHDLEYDLCEDCTNKLVTFLKG